MLAADDVRIAEVVATLSYAADLGLGQPMAHCMRQTVVALRRPNSSEPYRGAGGDVLPGADDERLLPCRRAEQAKWFGDDIGAKADLFETLK